MNAAATTAPRRTLRPVLIAALTAAPFGAIWLHTVFAYWQRFGLTFSAGALHFGTVLLPAGAVLSCGIAAAVAWRAQRTRRATAAMWRGVLASWLALTLTLIAVLVSTAHDRPGGMSALWQFFSYHLPANY